MRRLPWLWTWAGLLSLTTGACSPASRGGDGRGGGGVPGIGDLTPVGDHDPEIAETMPASIESSATTPPGPAGPLNWAPAGLLQNVFVAADRDSAIITVPAVAGAADYRVFALATGIGVNVVSGGEKVTGTDVFCAGNRQFNDVASATPVVMQQIEVIGLSGLTRLVV
jgi:hypothetical protein